MRLIGFEGVHDQIDLTSTAYLQCENKYEKCQLELGNSHHGTSRTRTVLYCTYSNKYAHMSMCVTSMHVHTVLPVVTRTSMYQMSLHPVIERSDSEENSTIIFPMARGIV